MVKGPAMPVPSERSEWLEPVVRRRCLGRLVGDCGTMTEPLQPCKPARRCGEKNTGVVCGREPERRCGLGANRPRDASVISLML